MKSAIAGGIMFLCWTFSAHALDPACGKGGMVLQRLDQCTRLYCAKQVKEESTREAIKAIDGSVAELQKQVSRLGDQIKKFQAVCQRLTKKFCEDCPDMLEFSDTHGLVEMTVNSSYRTEKKITGELAQALSKINTIEGDPGCHKQVKEQLDKEISLRDKLIAQFNKTQCMPDSIRREMSRGGK